MTLKYIYDFINLIFLKVDKANYKDCELKTLMSYILIYIYIYL